jgi:hypothetical protein
MAGRVGPVYAEEVFLAAGGPAWFHPALTDRERITTDCVQPQGGIRR